MTSGHGNRQALYALALGGLEPDEPAHGQLMTPGRVLSPSPPTKSAETPERLSRSSRGQGSKARGAPDLTLAFRLSRF